MLGILAAAAVAAAQPAPQANPAALAGSIRVFRVPAPPTALCKGAARIETAHQPALLLRPQDKADARARRLIELPMAEACLVAEPATGK